MHTACKILLEYQGTRENIIKDESRLRAIRLLKEARNRENIEVPFVSEHNRARIHVVKQEVLRDLTGLNSPKKHRRPLSLSPKGHSAIVAEMRVGQPASPMSPKTKSKHVGVHIGFQLNMIVTILRRVVDEYNHLSRLIFLRTLKKHNNSIKSVDQLVDFFKRKTLNSMYHAMHDLVDFCVSSSSETPHTVLEEEPTSPRIRFVPTILPIGETHPLMKVPPHIYDVGNRLNRFASVGRLTGVLLSIIRIQKLAVFNKLKKINLSKLYLLQRL